jgi:hypothetical protein
MVNKLTVSANLRILATNKAQLWNFIFHATSAANGYMIFIHGVEN